MKIFFVVGFVLALLWAIPFLTIASLNTLFGTGIAYGLGEWFASFYLMLITGTLVTAHKS